MALSNHRHAYFFDFFEILIKVTNNLYKLVISTVSVSMAMDEIPSVKLFLSSLKVAQYVLYSTIVMVYFKLKSYVVKSDPYNSTKFRIESHIKVGTQQKNSCSLVLKVKQ